MFSLFRTFLFAHPKSVLRMFVVFVLAFSGFLIIKQLTENVELTVARESRPFLGADITISTSEFMTGSIEKLIASSLSGAQYTSAEKTDFYTTLFDRDGKTGLVRVIAQSGAYPLYAVLRTEDISGQTGTAMANAPTIDRFASGGVITVDGIKIPIAKRIVETSETGFSFGDEGNILILPRATLSGSELFSRGSRMQNSLLLKLPSDEATDVLYKKLKADPALKKYQIKSYRSNANRTANAVEELSRYTLLVLVIGALFSAITLYSANETLLMKLRRSFGVFGLLGLTKRKKYLMLGGLYLLVIGLNFLISIGLSMWVIDFVSSFEEAKDFTFLISPLVFTGAIAGLLILATIVPSAVRFVSESPLSAIAQRGLIERKWFVYASVAIAIGSMFAMLYLIFESLLRAGLITLGMILGIVVLLYGLRAIFRVFFKYVRGLRGEDFFRFDGIRSLVRPRMPAGLVTLTLTTAIVCLFVFLAISMTFQERLRVGVADDTNMYAMNILGSDRAKVVEQFGSEGLYSILRGRIAAVNGKTLEKRSAWEEPSGDMTREFSITTNPLDDVRILRGTRALDGKSVTVDEGFATRLGVDVGDMITFMISGRSFDLQVSGVREVTEHGFRPFFYFQVNEQAFSQAPKTYFLATHTSDPEAFKKKMLGATGAHVTFVDVASVLEVVKTISNKILWVLALFLGFVTVFAILAVTTLFSSLEEVSRTKARLYRLFGAREWNVKQSLQTSGWVILGLCILLVGVIGGGVFAVVLSKMTFLKFSWSALALSIGFIGGMYAVLWVFLTRKLGSYSSTR